jgi:hypothetical protein
MNKSFCGVLREKFQFYEEFWKGEGSCPILFARPHLAKGKAYLKYNLVEQHFSAEKHLEDRLLEVLPHLDIIDDGIPTIRADLGTTLLPSGLGMNITVQEDLHPWLTEHLPPEQYLSLHKPVKVEEILHNEVILARQIYQLFFDWKERGKIDEAVIPYVPETEGVFDLSHLVIGTSLFLLMIDQPQLVHRIQQKSLQVYLAGTSFFKDFLGQPSSSMVHGHGMPVGVWFPDTGARISEDSCVLISSSMLREFCLPYIREAARPFGRLFMHYCGYHPDFLRMVCEMQEISTINLGNPEMYDLEEVFAICGETDTVYFGHFPMFNGEDSWSFLERIADSCRRHGARVILVCDIQPETPEEKSKLVQYWHHLTSRK